jgi:hypothetical protein
MLFIGFSFNKNVITCNIALNIDIALGEKRECGLFVKIRQ